MTINLSSGGYSTFALSGELLVLLRGLILSHITHTSHPGNQCSSGTDLENYLLSLPPLSRSSRTVPSEQVSKNSSLILSLLSDSIPRPDFLANNDLYFRIVRPSYAQEMSTPHRDIYFHNILPEWHEYLKTNNYKVWIPLIETKVPALGILPGSHLDQYHYDVNYEYFQCRPVSFKCSIKSEQLVPIYVPLGEGLLFPSSLIHGSLQRSRIASIRLSAELTIVYKDIAS